MILEILNLHRYLELVVFVDSLEGHNFGSICRHCSYSNRLAIVNCKRRGVEREDFIVRILHRVGDITTLCEN